MQSETLQDAMRVMEHYFANEWTREECINVIGYRMVDNPNDAFLVFDLAVAIYCKYQEKL